MVLKNLNDKYFSVENLKNPEMKVYYKERFQQCFSSLTLSIKFKSVETNHRILFHFQPNRECHLTFLLLEFWPSFARRYCILSVVILKCKYFCGVMLSTPLNSFQVVMLIHPSPINKMIKSIKAYLLLNINDNHNVLCTTYFAIV